MKAKLNSKQRWYGMTFGGSIANALGWCLFYRKDYQIKVWYTDVSRPCYQATFTTLRKARQAAKQYALDADVFNVQLSYTSCETYYKITD